MLNAWAVVRLAHTEQLMKENSYRILLVLSVAFVTAQLAASVAASSPREKDPERRPEAATIESVEVSPRGLESATDAVDPETSEGVTVQPRQKSDALSAPLANALNRSIDGLRAFELRNGGRGIHVEGRFQHALVARVQEDGSLEIVCINHPQEAEAFLKRASANADPKPLDK
jgi:hypothetical protein